MRYSLKITSPLARLLTGLGHLGVRTHDRRRARILRALRVTNNAGSRTIGRNPSVEDNDLHLGGMSAGMTIISHSRAATRLVGMRAQIERIALNRTARSRQG